MIAILFLIGALGPELATLDHAALVTATHAVVDTAGEGCQVELSAVGTSRAGLAIEALTLQPEGAPADRPALLLVAGLSGSEAFSSSLALHHARALAAGYGTDAGATALLDACTVHVIPRANPDAIEAFFAQPKRELLATGRGVDDDRDGEQGEDPPQDVDGDGMVTWMRVLDPEGEWIEDPTDPRALVHPDRKRGERGLWKLLGEARDLDGDDEVGEDDLHNAVVNRNFPAGWEEHQEDVGLWPGDEPEVRGLIDFVLAHRNLVLVVAFDAQGNLVELPDAVADDASAKQRIPPAGIRASDREHLERMAKRYTELTGSKVKGEREVPGSFQRWAYEHRGLLVLSAKPWEIPLGDETEPEDPNGAAFDDQESGPADQGSSEEEVEALVEEAPGEVPEERSASAAEEQAESATEEQPKPSDDAQRLAWIDARPAEAWRFKAWTPFEHPELGTVEIGGFTPLALTEPPAEARPALADMSLAWFVTLAEEFPRLEIARFERKRLGQGVWRVELVLENTGRMPLMTWSARRTRTLRPARVQLVLPPQATLLAGQVQHLVSDLGPIDGRFEATWLVQASNRDAIGIEIDTDHAGDLTANAEEMP